MPRVTGVDAGMRKRALFVLALSLVLVGGGAYLGLVRPGPSEPVYCDLVGHVTLVNASQVWLEDHGKPGRDECDIVAPSERFPLVLGYDCQVRNIDLEVVRSLEPPEGQDDCGLPG